MEKIFPKIFGKNFWENFFRFLDFGKMCQKPPLHTTVSEENTLHVRRHAFSRPAFHAKIFVPKCQRRYFNQTFDRSYYPNGMIYAWYDGWYGLCFIWQPNFVKNYSACCSRHSVYVFFNRLISRIENNYKFKPPRSDRGFLFEGFFLKFLHFYLFLSSHSDLFFQQLILLQRVTHESYIKLISWVAL